VPITGLGVGRIVAIGGGCWGFWGFLATAGSKFSEGSTGSENSETRGPERGGGGTGEGAGAGGGVAGGRRSIKSASSGNREAEAARGSCLCIHDWKLLTSSDVADGRVRVS
jgi:hypothetical protein